MLNANDPDFNEKLGEAIRALSDDRLIDVLDRSRPYDGQPHTDLGIRGKEEIRGLTMRDMHDCFVRGAFDACGLSPENRPDNIYALPWDDMDVMAVCQNMMCWVERYMGIFPNVEQLECKQWMDDFQQGLEDASEEVQP